jgi:hypothetical protein
MNSNAFRHTWIAIICLVAPSTSSGGFLDELADGIKGILQRPLECSAQAAPIGTHQVATLPVGTEIYKGPGANCGSYGVTNQPLTVSLIGTSGSWYLFNATDITGKKLQAWTSKNNVSYTGATQNQRQANQTIKYPSYSRELVANAQQSLNLRGYNAGVVDGLYGRGTRAAVIAFQQDAGLTPSGELDQSTLAALNVNAHTDVTRSTSSGTTRQVDSEPTPVPAQTKSAETPSTQSPVELNREGSSGETAVMLSKAELLDSSDPFASVITTISRGSRVKLIEVNGEWALIEYGGNKGYVYADQLR